MFLYVSLVQNASYERLGDKPWRIDEHKWNLTKMYVESLPLETKSLMSEASDSGMGTERAPSELDVDIGGQYRKVKVTHAWFLFLPSFCFCLVFDLVVMIAKKNRYHYS